MTKTNLDEQRQSVILTAMQKPRLAIIGYGQFGRFLAKHLRPHALITPFDKQTDPTKIKNAGVVIFAVPFADLPVAIQYFKPHISETAYIIDVTSIKVPVLDLLIKHFPQHHILGTHPIFGPQSGKHGIQKLPLVLCNVSVPTKEYCLLKQWLKKQLVLTIIEMTAEQHDEEMALVQGLTHFIGRAVTEMQIPSLTTNTKSYQHLIELQSLIGNDSWDLFLTIQNGNPKAASVRKKFLETLQSLDGRLGNAKS